MALRRGLTIVFPYIRSRSSQPFSYLHLNDNQALGRRKVPLAVKLDSEGPAILRRRRVGQNGEIFEILKLRSMYVDADKRFGRQRASGQNPRITCGGRGNSKQISNRTHRDSAESVRQHVHDRSQEIEPLGWPPGVRSILTPAGIRRPRPSAAPKMRKIGSGK